MPARLVHELGACVCARARVNQGACMRTLTWCPRHVRTDELYNLQALPESNAQRYDTAWMRSALRHCRFAYGNELSDSESDSDFDWASGETGASGNSSDSDELDSDTSSDDVNQ